jgi:hypothetical protein
MRCCGLRSAFSANFSMVRKLLIKRIVFRGFDAELTMELFSSLTSAMEVRNFERRRSEGGFRTPDPAVNSRLLYH